MEAFQLALRAAQAECSTRGILRVLRRLRWLQPLPHSLGTCQNANPLFSTPALGQAGVTVLTLCEMLHFVLLHVFLDKKDHFSSESIVFAKGGYWGFISCPWHAGSYNQNNRQMPQKSTGLNGFRFCLVIWRLSATVDATQAATSPRCPEWGQ